MTSILGLTKNVEISKFFWQTKTMLFQHAISNEEIKQHFSIMPYAHRMYCNIDINSLLLFSTLILITFLNNYN